MTAYWRREHTCDQAGCTDLAYDDSDYCRRCQAEQRITSRLAIETDRPRERVSGGALISFWVCALIFGGFTLYCLGWFVGCVLGWWPMPNAPVDAVTLP